MELILLVLLVITIILLVYLAFFKTNKPNEITNQVDVNNVLNEQKTAIIKELAEYQRKIMEGYTEASVKNERSLNEFKEKLEDRVNKLFVQNEDRLNATTKEITASINEKMKEINDKVDNRLTEGFEKSTKTFGDVLERLGKIDEAQKKLEGLSNNIISLQDILSNNKSRGNFGEYQLNQILEDAFGVQDDDVYQVQKMFTGIDGSKLMADAALRMPDNDLWLAIDSKFPLENYEKMISKDIPDSEQKNYEKLFVKDVKNRVDETSKYIINGVTLDQAIMFIPSESIYAQILAYHKDVVAYATKKKVLLSGPTNLLALLRVFIVLRIDEKRTKCARELFGELNKLSEEFGRYSERWIDFEKKFKGLDKEVDKITVTSKKISSKFEKIKDVKIDELESE